MEGIIRKNMETQSKHHAFSFVGNLKKNIHRSKWNIASDNITCRDKLYKIYSSIYNPRKLLLTYSHYHVIIY